MEAFVKQQGLELKVKFIGKISHEELCNYYSKSFAVFFSPLDEDLDL